MNTTEYESNPYDPIIALTFDDGPNTTTTNQILDILKKYRIRASFFIVGDNINGESALIVKKAYDMGCEINNHSKTHSLMTEMTAEEIRAEIRFVSDMTEKITGEPTRFFRPPYIAVNDIMFQNIDLPFIGGYGCNDWDDSVSVQTRIEAIERQACDGMIILLHDSEGNSKTVEALDTIIPDLKDRGFQFVTVSELFKAKGINVSKSGAVLYERVQRTEQKTCF